MPKLFLLLVLVGMLAGCRFPVLAQQKYIQKDAIPGKQGPERSAFDARHYRLDITPDFAGKSIRGVVEMLFDAHKPIPGRLQFDLDSILSIDSIVAFSGERTEAATWRSEHVVLPFPRPTFTRAKRVVSVDLPEKIIDNLQNKGENTITLSASYHGKPQPAIKPPWDGAFVWRKDSLGRDWLAVACESAGASTWWPCKDDAADKPDEGVTIGIKVPLDMIAISNGELTRIEPSPRLDSMRYMYTVTNPINLYNVTLNVGHYSTKNHTIKLKSGKKVPFTVAAMDYHIDSYDKYLNFEGQRVVKIFSKLFGDYPFIKDGYRLVETPYWGMEHQSCVAYGNKLQRNKYGFDFIVVHESGHEWWGNAVSMSDPSELWIHETFCTYAELLFLEETKGRKVAEQYFREYILHRLTGKGSMLGVPGERMDPYNTEVYFRGAAVVHLFRQMLNEDALFHKTLKAILEAHRNRPASTESVLEVINKTTGRNFTPLFMQYLTDRGYPVLTYSLADDKLFYRLANAENGLELPVIVKVGEEMLDLAVKTTWQRVALRKSVGTNTVTTIELIKPSYLLKTESVTVLK